jgi:hypothetical protein
MRSVAVLSRNCFLLAWLLAFGLLGLAYGGKKWGWIHAISDVRSERAMISFHMIRIIP